MIRAIALLSLLTVACAHQQRPMQPLPELPRYELQSRLADVPEDEGGGGFLPLIPYYVASETTAQAEPPPVGTGTAGSLYSLTLTAPQGTASSPCLVAGGTGTSGMCFGGYPGASGAIYSGITPSTRNGSNYMIGSAGTNTTVNAPSASGIVQLLIGGSAATGWKVDSAGHWVPLANNANDIGTFAIRPRDGYFGNNLDVAANVVAGNAFVSNVPGGSNGVQLNINGARLDLGTGANDYLYSDGTKIITPGTINAARVEVGTSGLDISGNTTFAGNISQSDSNGVQPVRITDSAGLGFTGATTAALPACNSTAVGGANGTLGTIQYDTTRNALVLCNGTAWRRIEPQVGTIALSAGTAAVTVDSGAICVVGSTTANHAYGSVAATTLTVNGTGTDTVTYSCR